MRDSLASSVRMSAQATKLILSHRGENKVIYFVTQPNDDQDPPIAIKSTKTKFDQLVDKVKEKFSASLQKDKLVRFKFRPLGREEDICIEVDDQTGIELLAQFEAKYCK